MANTLKPTPLPPMDEKEKQRRFEAARSAEASLRIEGLFVSPEDKVLSDKWVNGEITDEEYEQLAGLSA